MDVTKSLMREYIFQSEHGFAARLASNMLVLGTQNTQICDDACMGVFCFHNKIIVVVLDCAVR